MEEAGNMTGAITFQRGQRRRVIAAMGVAAFALAGCAEGEGPAFLQRPAAGAEADSGVEVSRATQLVERDVEAPDVFQVTEKGLWDGRPSLGGVWVAHPDVAEPERVIIRNRENGQFVIGALFRRERDNPGPALQVSSDAAEALGMLAGAPAELNVTALRREEVTEDAIPAPVATLEGAAEVTTTALDAADAGADAVLAGAAAAIETAEASAAPAPAPTPAAAPAPAASGLSRPYIQIGIFSVEDNALRTADRMRAAGIVPTVLDQESQGRRFFRVIVGPATSEAERATLLEKVKGLGFEDAYFVRN